MTPPSRFPGVARRGFRPAGPKRAVRRGMLIPKPRERATNPALDPTNLWWLAGQLGPPERLALREIVETGDIVFHNRHPYIVARVSRATLDAIAVFEAEGEDLEPDDEGDPLDDREGHVWEDLEPDHEAGEPTEEGQP